MDDVKMFLENFPFSSPEEATNKEGVICRKKLEEPY